MIHQINGIRNLFCFAKIGWIQISGQILLDFACNILRAGSRGKKNLGASIPGLRVSILVNANQKRIFSFFNHGDTIVKIRYFLFADCSCMIVMERYIFSTQHVRYKSVKGYDIFQFKGYGKVNLTFGHTCN